MFGEQFLFGEDRERMTGGSYMSFSLKIDLRTMI
jgi:hypothetical protein